MFSGTLERGETRVDVYKKFHLNHVNSWLVFQVLTVFAHLLSPWPKHAVFFFIVDIE